MSGGFLLSWQAVGALFVFVGLALAAIRIFLPGPSRDYSVQRLAFGYLCALAALGLITAVQSNSEPSQLLGQITLGSYIVLPWITLIVLPIMLLQAKPGQSVRTILLFALAVDAVIMVSVWPNSEGIDKSMLMKSQLQTALELFVLLAAPAIGFSLGSRASWLGRSGVK